MSGEVVTKDYGPTHLVAFSDSPRTLCGIKHADAFPRMLARFVVAHRAGHERVGKTFRACPECESAAIEQGISFGELRDQ